MERPPKVLANSKESPLLLREFDPLSAIALLFAIGVSIIAFLDPDFRVAYGEIATLVVGGYLARLKPP